MHSVKSAFVRGLEIGGKAPVRIQSMYESSVLSSDADAILARIEKLRKMGMDLIRFSFSSRHEADAFAYIAEHSPVPVVADIHFDYRLALLAIESKADKIRINPGNIGAEWKTREIVRSALDHGTAIRIGLNTGSLKASRDDDKAKLMADTALDYIDILESCGFENTVVSLKSSDIDTCVRASRIFASQSGYPLHLGVTEAGPAATSLVRSTWAIGNLLESGIGDTVRISITGNMEDEVLSCAELLRTLGMYDRGIRLVSCPCCGRHTLDTEAFMRAHRDDIMSLDGNCTIAVMGCQVNGPGEARDADYAITGFAGRIYIYRKGEKAAECTQDEAFDVLSELMNER